MVPDTHWSSESKLEVVPEVVAVLVVVLVAVLVAEDVGVVVTLAESVVVGVLRAHVANVPSRNELTMSLRYLKSQRISRKRRKKVTRIG